MNFRRHWKDGYTTWLTTLHENQIRAAVAALDAADENGMEDDPNAT